MAVKKPIALYGGELGELLAGDTISGGGGGGASDPRTKGFALVTDFMNTNAVQHQFIGAAISTGTIATNPAAGVGGGNHPGVWLVRSSTTANSGYRCQTDADEFRIAGGEVFDIVFRTPAVLTALLYRFGFSDNASATDAVDGCYLEMLGTGVIAGKTSNNSVRTTSATIATLAINTWYYGRITVNADATSVLFEVYSDAGVLLGSQSITTNIPTASGRECGAGFIMTQSGTVAIDVGLVDYMSVKITRTLVRGAA